MDQFGEEVKMKQQTTKQTNELNLLNMIESRIMEIIQIEDECKRKLPKLFHQRLPRFMRRRAACHNPKRIPRKLRPSEKSDFGKKDRKNLLKYRTRLKFRKHKRILKKHAKHKYNDPFKCLLHKWFAKRFKLGYVGSQNYVPLHNNTKNQRNLYRQTVYGCAYLSLAHLIPLRVNLDLHNLDEQLEHLNNITNETSGFTFCAKSIQKGNYEIIIHIYKLNTTQRVYLCPAIVNLKPPSIKKSKNDTKGNRACLTLWLPRENYQEVHNNLVTITNDYFTNKETSIVTVYPKEWTRIRLVGPNAHEESMKIAENREKHLSAINDVKYKLNKSLGLTIGRYIQESYANYTYYYTKPIVVDIVFKNRQGRMLWYQLIKNKSHLVGGYRDIDRLLIADCFKIEPDNCDKKEIDYNMNEKNEND